jgi:hypothetical protein
MTMSKQSRKKARHRKRHVKTTLLMSTICPDCGVVDVSSPASLLNNLADALNSCADAGVKVRMRHGALLAAEGYVLPLAGGRWTARTLNYDPFISLPELADDDFD